MRKIASYTVGKHDYYVGYTHARKQVGVLLDAQTCVFQVLLQGRVIGEKEIEGVVGHEMSFQDYLKHMLVEAQTTDQHSEAI